LVFLGYFHVQNAYVSTSGSCGEFHEENSMLYIQNPSPGDHNNLDGFFLHRVSPLEMVGLWLYSSTCSSFSEYQFETLTLHATFLFYFVNLSGIPVDKLRRRGCSKIFSTPAGKGSHVNALISLSSQQCKHNNSVFSIGRSVFICLFQYVLHCQKKASAIFGAPILWKTYNIFVHNMHWPLLNIMN
jgi:hypothetical protein